MKKIFLAVAAAGIICSCAVKKEDVTVSGLKVSDFQTEVIDGKQVSLYVLKNQKGAEACITNYGGRLVSLMVPDKNGTLTDVVLGYDNIADYVADVDGNFGALIGRYGNRIANAEFTIDETKYSLPKNDNENCLHGGPKGYHVKYWDAKPISNNAIELTYLSKDGEAGFPGNLNIKVTYTLTEENAIDIQYEATTDKTTVVNLTNHSYFNLNGNTGCKVLDQIVSINADTYTEVNENLIPTSNLPLVEGTPLDLRKPVAIGAHIDDDFDQLKKGNGYDFNWVLNTKGDVSKVAATAYSPKTGIYMEVFTNEPGIQFYTGNFLSGKNIGKHGVCYPHRGAFCLETQHYPDSPNQESFPSVLLKPGEIYKSQCVYKFSVK